jgi:hypothetical protein
LLRDVTKLIKYQGILLPKYSKAEALNAKPENCQLRCIGPKNASGQYAKDLIKLMFADEPACNSFKTQLEKALASSQ